MKRKMEKKQEQFFDALYERWFSKLCIYANVKINNLPVAEEIVQDAFLVAFLKIEQLMEAEQPERWLKKTVKHKILHYFRDQDRTFGRVLPLADVPERWVAALDERIEKIEASEEERRNDLKKLLENTLKEEEQQLLRKIAWEEKSYETAAEELGLSLWACQKRMQRLRKKIRKALEAYHGEE